MKFLMGALATLFFVSVPALASVCPTTAFSNTDCSYIITIEPSGSLAGMAVANANPYDGRDDALIGVVNNSGAVYSGSFVLSASLTADIFGFDGDGICTLIAAPYCATAATGYEGPLNTFTGISSDKSSGTVVITGLDIGATTYFSLEEAPDTIGSVAPEPGSIAMLGAGLVALVIISRSKRRAAPSRVDTLRLRSQI